MDPIRFYGAVAKVQTMVDGGLRIWLDLPEGAIVQAAELMACKRHGQVLDFVATAHQPEKQERTGGTTGDLATRTKRKPKWATEEKPSDDRGSSSSGQPDTC